MALAVVVSACDIVGSRLAISDMHPNVGVLAPVAGAVDKPDGPLSPFAQKGESLKMLDGVDH